MLADLPSADAAKRLVRGESAAIPAVIFTTLARAALIGAGMYVVSSNKDMHTLSKQAIAGAVAVELFVLGWALHEEKQQG